MKNISLGSIYAKVFFGTVLCLLSVIYNLMPPKALAATRLVKVIISWKENGQTKSLETKLSLSSLAFAAAAPEGGGGDDGDGGDGGEGPPPADPPPVAVGIFGVASVDEYPLGGSYESALFSRDTTTGAAITYYQNNPGDIDAGKANLEGQNKHIRVKCQDDKLSDPARLFIKNVDKGEFIETSIGTFTNRRSDIPTSRYRYWSWTALSDSGLVSGYEATADISTPLWALPAARDDLKTSQQPEMKFKCSDGLWYTGYLNATWGATDTFMGKYLATGVGHSSTQLLSSDGWEMVAAGYANTPQFNKIGTASPSQFLTEAIDAFMDTKPIVRIALNGDPESNPSGVTWSEPALLYAD